MTVTSTVIDKIQTYHGTLLVTPPPKAIRATGPITAAMIPITAAVRVAEKFLSVIAKSSIDIRNPQIVGAFMGGAGGPARASLQVGRELQKVELSEITSWAWRH